MRTVLKHLPDGESPLALPRGLDVVLAKHTSGFWGQLDDTPAYPEFSIESLPTVIYTFEPWLGCPWGASCEFCYVRNASLRFYPGGKEGYWYNQWGYWLLPKPDITVRLHRLLLDPQGSTRRAYQGAFVYMAAKTDPFLPLPDTLEVTRANLDVFARADVFLMCQTRCGKVVEDPEVLDRITEMARHKKVGVSFSIATDLLEEQRRIVLLHGLQKKTPRLPRRELEVAQRRVARFEEREQDEQEVEGGERT